MKSFSLEPGTQVRLFQRGLVVEKVQGKSFILRNIRSQELETKKLAELRKAYEEGHMRFADLLDGLDDDEWQPSSALEKQLSDFNPTQRSGALTKYEYLKAICPRGRLKVSRAELPDELHRIWHGLPTNSRGEHPPSVSSFYSWRSAWLLSSHNLARLVNRADLRGRRPPPVDENVRPILENAITSYFATPERPPITEVVKLSNAILIRQNKVRSPCDQLPVITTRQVVREIDRVDRFELLKRRYGVARARTATRVFGEKSEVLRPLQRVEIDHTPLDVLCLSDDLQRILGRAYATVVIDVATRMILAIWISFRPPNADSVLRALKQAILPKDGLLKAMGLKGDWPAWGLMETLYLDNGKEFHSNALEAALSDLGITAVFCPPREPFMKGTIERFLKSLNYDAVHRFPGTTFAKFGLREDYRSEMHAALTLSDVRRLVVKWVVEVYSREWHRGIQACPLQKWLEFVDPAAQRLPARVDILDVVLAPSVERHLTSKGIEINGLHYTCQTLGELRLAREKRTLAVRPNHDDVGEIQVLNPDTQQYFSAQCTRPEYACGLSLEQHGFLRKRARDAYAALPYYEALLVAKLEIHEELQELVARHKAGKPSNNGGPQRRVKRSGLERQAQTEFAAQRQPQSVEAAPKQPASDSVWSFDDVPTFPTGQASLFQGELHAA